MPNEYRLPEAMRPRLAKPLGRFFTGDEVNGRTFEDLVKRAPVLVTVGDRVTETVGRLGRTPDVQVIDSMENRKAREPPDVPYRRRVKVRNPAGTITGEAITGIRSAFEGAKPVRVLVDGEEDLLTIPAVALAPSSALILYGQPGEGIVVVKADAEAKERNRAILAEIGIPEIT